MTLSGNTSIWQLDHQLLMVVDLFHLINRKMLLIMIWTSLLKRRYYMSRLTFFSLYVITYTFPASIWICVYTSGWGFVSRDYCLFLCRSKIMFKNRLRCHFRVLNHYFKNVLRSTALWVEWVLRLRFLEVLYFERHVLIQALDGIFIPHVKTCVLIYYLSTHVRWRDILDRLRQVRNGIYAVPT